jgi:hypothetical protein
MIARNPPSYPVEERERAKFHTGGTAILDGALEARAPRPEPEPRMRPKI